MRTKVSFPALLLLITVAAALPPVHAQTARTEPFVLGADISWIPQREAEGVRYAHNGQVRDILDILKEHRFNYIRLRLFVDPTRVVPEDSINGLTGAWRASPYSRAGYCGLDSTIKFAQRVKNAGFKILLNFHYSDTWADPGKQYMPVSWRNLTTVDQVAQRVRTYTRESVQAFKDAGVLPDMVQVGNETINGMIHPHGRNWNDSEWRNFARLIHAGINGVRDVDANIVIMVHSVADSGWSDPNNWLTRLRTNLNQVEANFFNRINVFGISYYPRWHGNLTTLQNHLNAIIANRDHNHIRINIVEYADLHRGVNDIVFNLPNNRGHGTFVWEPQEFSGDNSLPLFDWRNNRRETNSRIALYPIMSRDYGNDAFTNIAPNTSAPARKHNPRNDFHVSHNGVITYNSDMPGTVTIYNMQGRVAGRFNVRGPGVYNPAQLTRTPLNPGVYIIAIEPANGNRQVFNSRIM